MLLRILSYVYGAGAYLRRELYEKGVLKTKKLPRPVISIGNLSVGGTGKTPLTIYTARKLIEKGFNVCVLSRGYKRESKGTVVVSDGNNIFVNWRESGDEAFLIARNGIPVVVSSSRYEAGMKALNSMDVDVFLLDDGFQHFQLHRDIDIITVDATKPFWEDRLLPEGRLREPPEFYRYADIIVVSKIFSIDEIKKKKIIEKLDSFGKPYFLSTEKMNSLTDGKRIYSLEFLKGKKVGIFFRTWQQQAVFDAIKDLSERYSFEIVEFISFPDHYDYTDLRLDKKADIWLTTEKDLIKIEKNESIFALKYSIDLRPDYMDMIIGRLK